MIVKILSYNVWGMPWGTKQMHEIMLWLLCHSKADVICLQEVFSKKHREIIQSKAEAAHWQVIFPEDPCLAGMCFNAFQSGSGLCILVSPTIEILQEIPFIPYRHVDAYIERLVKKGFYGVQLQKEGVFFSLLNTHMIADVTDCSPIRIAHGLARRFQEKQLVETAKTIKGPVLIVGDLNQEEHHYLHRMYPHEDWTFPSTLEQLDHVVCLPSDQDKFITKQVTFYQDIRYSDHIPIRVDVEIA